MSTISSTNISRKKGSSGGRLAGLLPSSEADCATALRKTKASISTTGTSMATRNILASVAALAISGDRMLPAPTTCVTS